MVDLIRDRTGGSGDDALSADLSLDEPSEISSVTARLDGRSGNDTLTVSLFAGEDLGGDPPLVAFSTSVFGGSGNDIISVAQEGYNLRSTQTEIDAGSGSDQITLRLYEWEMFSQTDRSDTRIDAGSGNDTVDAIAYSSTAGVSIRTIGGSGNDHISATAQSVSDGGHETYNFASGDEGDDWIELSAASYAATSHIVGDGGAGNDTLFASDAAYSLGELHVELDGGDGDDEISVAVTPGGNGDGQSALNELRGGDGNDSLSAETVIRDDLFPSMEAVNDLRGGDGDDRLTARMEIASGDGLAYNTLSGGDGADRLWSKIAGTGHSELLGGEGNDRLSVKGGEGNILSGNQGEDVLLGSSGADRMTGGQGDDYLRGRGGDDTFVFMGIRDGERDRIADMTPGEDVIDLSSIDANAFRSGNQAFAFAGGDDWHGTGRVWVEQSKGASSIVHADTGKAVLEIVLLDGRDVGPDHYTAEDFIL